MTDLNALMVFARVVESESFSEAARRLRMPVSTVSRKVAELENELGIRLLERSTRSLRLTEIGREIFLHAQRSVDINEAVESTVSDQLTEVRGTLRLSAPPSISDAFLVPIITAFQKSHPNVSVNVLVTDRLVDYVSDGVDLSIRLGSLEDSALIARPLLRYCHQLVASPAYLENKKKPKKPNDLMDHRLLAFSFWNRRNRWTLVRGDAYETITFKPHLAMNDFAGLAAALEAGAGIGDLPPLVAPHLIAEGKLVRVLPKWRFRTIDLSLVHPRNRHMTRPVRLFKDFAAEMAPTLLKKAQTASTK